VFESDREVVMSDHVYKKIEIVGSSKQSSDDAVRNALARAAGTVRHMDWFEVVETRGHIVDGQVAHWQVVVKIGFRLEGD
jgi:flavin-binding protein dodecin